MDFMEKYQAISTSDPACDGRFWFAVRTTGIFCRPSCRARTPKAENVEFFASSQQALQAGYRPCKLCHPLEIDESTPGMISQLLEEIEANPGARIRDDQLRQRGLDPEFIRRWFKKRHGLTFQGYQRARRLTLAFGLVRSGTSVTEAASATGFDSLSAFGESFRSSFGVPPSKSGGLKVVTFSRIPTPLGLMVAATLDEGICLLEFSDRRALETEMTELQGLLGAKIMAGTHPLLDRLSQELSEYFAGTRQEFDLPIHSLGTNFQDLVWSALRKIPYGSTRSYAEQAIAIGRPSAVRAVASANGHNRLAILVPCHRVIGSNGTLTGYSGGVWRKQWLLDLEAGRLVDKPN